MALRTLMLSVILISVTGFVRQDVSPPDNPDWYWRYKVQWHSKAQVVLAGNSRVYRGLDPSVFENHLGKYTVLNAGFSSAVWSHQYLDYLENLLTRSSVCCVVLGIDPTSLVRPSYRNGSPFEDTGFGKALEDDAKTRIPAIWEARWSAISRRLRPFGIAQNLERTDENYLQKFHYNGWVESDYVCPNPEIYLREKKSRIRELQQVDPDTYRLLLERIKQWRDQGVVVLGFRPPTTPQTDAFENEVHWYDEKKVADGVISAGGYWVELNQKADFISYDGSHLNADSAKRLSLYLADSIKRYLGITRDVANLKAIN